MTVATAATTHTKKLVKLGLSLFRWGFNSSKCKTAAKMAVARIKLLRNKGQVVVRQMRRDIALLLKSGQDATARIRVEHVIREQNVLAANEIIELFCELVVARLTIIAKQRECPADLKEGIASLIFAAPRCSEIPELTALRDIFEKKYGKDFVSAATDLRPNAGVNRMLIEKLSVRSPTGEVKLKIMKEIAKEYQIEWDTTESEEELLKPPEEPIQGPRNFVSASSLPVHNQSVQPKRPENSSLRRTSGGGGRERGGGYMHFVDTASAASAAAKSASDAISAAQAAADLANKDFNQASQAPPFDYKVNNDGFGTLSSNSTGRFMPDGAPVDSQNMHHQSKARGIDRSRSTSNEETMHSHGDDNRFIYRRYSYNPPSKHSDIKFDDSDCDEEIEMESPPAGIHPPPERPPPSVPSAAVKQDSFSRVHPNLPDYDALAARFEALKHQNHKPK